MSCNHPSPQIRKTGKGPDRISLGRFPALVISSSAATDWRPAPQQILGNLVFCFALSAPGPKEATMKTLITILTLTLFTIAPAAAESAKSFAPGHHKSVHGASYNAPGHVKKRLHMQSARGIAPGHKKY